MLYWDKLLNPKRFRETSSVTKTTSDNRSPFKKDFDTVCNSTILRRLQDKAQVFPLEQEDYARTRLTHSIEVMSVASSLAVQATKVILETNFDQYLSNDFKLSPEASTFRDTIKEISTILNTAALLHDMGNPPFGHLGEQIISDWFKNNLPKIIQKSDGSYVFNDVGSADDTLAYKLKGQYADDLMHFEGNAQLLRLVTKLSYVVDKHGMNLSFPVLASFIKYPCSSTNINKAKLSTKKMGYFTSEAAEYSAICEVLGLHNCRHPLSFLLEAADDIAYLSADIEDAQHKGIVTVDCLISYLQEAAHDSIVERVLKEIERYRADAIGAQYSDIDGYIIHRTRIYIKGVMIDAMYDSFKDLYEEIMNGTCEKELIAHSNVATLADILRKIEREKIYYCKEIVESKTRAFTIISKLLDVYVPAVLSHTAEEYGKDTASNLLYLSLSTNYRYICEITNDSENDENKKIYNRLLLVTDQISGMTDSHAMTVYRTVTATKDLQH